MLPRALEQGMLLARQFRVLYKFAILLDDMPVALLNDSCRPAPSSGPTPNQLDMHSEYLASLARPRRTGKYDSPSVVTSGYRFPPLQKT